MVIMTQSYSQEDFSKMQQQAINRVKEMQRQAKVKNTNEPEETGDVILSNEKSVFETSSSSKPPERIFKPMSAPPPITHVHTGRAGTISSFFEMDSDIALLLPLLLLLQRDKADEMLILALLYIMA